MNHYYTCIKHEWEGYLGDVGQRCKAKNGEDPGLPPLRDKSVRAWPLNGGASTQVTN